MSVVVVLLTIVEVLCALLLILLVLLQRSKDEGMGMAFGGAMGESLFGSQATTILTKITVILAVVFMLNTIMLDRLYSRGTRSSSSSILDKLEIPAAAPIMPIEADQQKGPVEEDMAPSQPAAEQPSASMPVPSAVIPEVPAAEAPAAPAPAPATVPAS
jgi:preprotein translocase subunit SecG